MHTRYLIPALLIGLMTLILSGCDNSGESQYIEQVVMDGFLYVGHPLEVRLSRTVPIEQYYDPAAVAMSGANVTIWANGQEFVLPENPNRRGAYSLPADSHVVTAGLSYRIRAEVAGHVLTAETDSAAAALRIDSTSFPVWRDPSSMDTIEYGDDAEFYLRWNMDPRNEGYTVIIENIEPDWFADWRKVSGNNGPDMSSFWFWAMRWARDMQVPWITLGYTGRHRVRVLSCDKAAYDYLFTSFPGNPEHHPESNVEGGLGIFCAVGADTAYFYLKDDVKNE